MKAIRAYMNDRRDLFVFLQHIEEVRNGHPLGPMMSPEDAVDSCLQSFEWRCQSWDCY